MSISNKQSEHLQIALPAIGMQTRTKVYIRTGEWRVSPKQHNAAEAVNNQRVPAVS